MSELLGRWLDKNVYGTMYHRKYTANCARVLYKNSSLFVFPDVFSNYFSSQGTLFARYWGICTIFTRQCYQKLNLQLILNLKKNLIVDFDSFGTTLRGAWVTKCELFYKNLILELFAFKTIWAMRLATSYFPSNIYALQLFKNQTVALTVKRENFFNVIHFFKNSWWFRATLLCDLFAVDYSARVKRFEVSYCLISLKRCERYYLKIFLTERAIIPSVTTLFSSSDWLERETWDMYGIVFGGHPDLRRILTDYGFVGYPLRKDFPLTGFFEYRYNDTTKLVVSESVNLLQEFRLFFFSANWQSFTWK